jgi:hypothetical protein
MKVVGNKNYKIYVYPEDHPPPHCHVRFKDGRDVTVDVPLIEPRYGATISKEVRETIADNMEEICKAWEELNEKQHNENETNNDTLE